MIIDENDDDIVPEVGENQSGESDTAVRNYQLPPQYSEIHNPHPQSLLAEQIPQSDGKSNISLRNL